jgi:hypothetical protein
MTRFLPLPPRGRSGSWVFALAIALVLAVQPIWPDRTAIGVVGAIGLTLLAAMRWRLRWLPVLVLVICAISLRYSVMDRKSSDVSDVTRSAIFVTQLGDNPYGVTYLTSNPPGAPFPYGPVDLAWYAPFVQDPRFLELMVSIGLTIYFGVRAANGRPVGLAIFALAPPLVLASVDGSNDTSAGLLILLALAVAARRPAVGAGILAVAVAFKPYAIAWIVPLVAWAGLPAAVAFVGASVIAWSPVWFHWGVGSYLRSLALAQETHLRQSYWSLGAILDDIAPDAVSRWLETLRYAVSGGIAVLGSLRVRTIDGVIVVGTLAFVAAQFGGYFGSYVYLAAIAPILCWRVDDWLGRALPEVVRAYALLPSTARGTAPTRRIRRPAPATAAGSLAASREVVHGPARLAQVIEGQRGEPRATGSHTA